VEIEATLKNRTGDMECEKKAKIVFDEDDRPSDLVLFINSVLATLFKKVS